MLNCFNYLLASMFIYSTLMSSRPNGGGTVEGIFYRNIPFRYKTTANSVERTNAFDEDEDDAGEEDIIGQINEGQIMPKAAERDNDKNNENGIRTMLNEIEAQESRLLAHADDGSAHSRMPSSPARRTARLIPRRSSPVRGALSSTDIGRVSTAEDNDEYSPLDRHQQQQPNIVVIVDGEEGKAVAYGGKGSGIANGNSPTEFAVPSSSLRSLIALRPDYAFKNVAAFLQSFFDSRMERSRKSDATAADNVEEGRHPSTAVLWARSMAI